MTFPVLQPEAQRAKSLLKVTELVNVKAGIQLQAFRFHCRQAESLVQAAPLLNRECVQFIFASVEALNSAPSNHLENMWINHG